MKHSTFTLNNSPMVVSRTREVVDINITGVEVATQPEDEASHNISQLLQTLEIDPHVRFVAELGTQL